VQAQQFGAARPSSICTVGDPTRSGWQHMPSNPDRSDRAARHLYISRFIAARTEAAAMRGSAHGSGPSTVRPCAGSCAASHMPAASEQSHRSSGAEPAELAAPQGREAAASHTMQAASLVSPFASGAGELVDALASQQSCTPQATQGIRACMHWGLRSPQLIAALHAQAMQAQHAPFGSHSSAGRSFRSGNAGAMATGMPYLHGIGLQQPPAPVPSV
jgi:hypothetical protein